MSGLDKARAVEAESESSPIRTRRCVDTKKGIR